MGHWRYCTQLGTRNHEERYHRPFSDIAFYLSNGRVAQKGHVRVADEGTKLHYFWFGKWQEFSNPATWLRSMPMKKAGK